MKKNKKTYTQEEFETFLKVLSTVFDKKIYISNEFHDSFAREYSNDIAKTNIHKLIEYDSPRVIEEYLRKNFNKTIFEEDIEKLIEKYGEKSSIAYGYEDYLMYIEDDGDES